MAVQTLFYQVQGTACYELFNSVNFFGIVEVTQLNFDQHFWEYSSLKLRTMVSVKFE